MTRRSILALALLCALGTGAVAGDEAELDPAPYPPSFRANVQEAIETGVARLQALQAEAGHWGAASEVQSMGHTGLALMAALKGGLDPASETVTRAFAWLRGLPMQATYGVSCYLMSIWARHAPLVDVFEREAPSSAEEPVAPADLWKRLDDADRDALDRGVAFVVGTQRKNGLFDYHLRESPPDWAYDLSNTLYAVLGLRAAAACGAEVPDDAWLRAVDGILSCQEEEGPRAKLLRHTVKNGKVKTSRATAKARGFRYKLDKQDGPAGPWTVFTYPVTGSMTTAGLTALTICRDELSRSRTRLGKRGRLVEAALRDGLAWLQENFTVASNPGQVDAYHFDYLYGLERIGMLNGHRWIGRHDWYHLGADFLLSTQDDPGWGAHVRTSFAILFLKRATPPPAVTGR